MSLLDDYNPFDLECSLINLSLSYNMSQIDTYCNMLEHYRALDNQIKVGATLLWFLLAVNYLKIYLFYESTNRKLIKL